MGPGPGPSCFEVKPAGKIALGNMNTSGPRECDFGKHFGRAWAPAPTPTWALALGPGRDEPEGALPGKEQAGKGVGLGAVLWAPRPHSRLALGPGTAPRGLRPGGGDPEKGTVGQGTQGTKGLTKALGTPIGPVPDKGPRCSMAQGFKTLSPKR